MFRSQASSCPRPQPSDLWIQRINAAACGVGVSYSKLIGALDQANIQLDREMLAEIALRDPVAFHALARCP